MPRGFYPGCVIVGLCFSASLLTSWVAFAEELKPLFLTAGLFAGAGWIIQAYLIAWWRHERKWTRR